VVSKKRNWIIIVAVILLFAGINEMKDSEKNSSDENKISQVASKKDSKKSEEAKEKESSDEETSNDQTDESEEPKETKKPEEKQEPVKSQEPTVPTEYRSALRKAESYSRNMHMSKRGIQQQLTSEYGEKFSAEAAQYAIDHMTADWNKNALEKAKSYQRHMSMSPESIRDQLTSEYGEKFTPEEANYAINNLE
jgi:Host cell surface-exposed lipoprotein.